MPRKCWWSFSSSFVILFLRKIFQRRKPKILFWLLVFCAVTTCVIGKVSLAMITSIFWCLVDRVCVDPTFSTNLATKRFLIIGNFFTTASRRELCVALRRYFSGVHYFVDAFPEMRHALLHAFYGEHPNYYLVGFGVNGVTRGLSQSAKLNWKGPTGHNRGSTSQNSEKD